MKAEMKERTMKAFLLSQKHIVYTDPLDVRAGTTVSVYYNPRNTNLHGKNEVWYRGSFNRWTHRKGPLPPLKMIPTDDDGPHVKCNGALDFITKPSVKKVRFFIYYFKLLFPSSFFSVNVPLDAYMMDFVFSDREDGGTFDNKYGMDYHVPVSGGITKEPPMHIVHISVEMAPVAKVKKNIYIKIIVGLPS